MPDRVPGVSRRGLLRRSLLCSALFGPQWRPSLLAAADEVAEPFLERAAAGKPHRGKVLLAVQAHSDDIPLLCPGVVAKLVNEGYTGYLVRTTNDDMGDAPGLGTPGTVGDNVLANERDNAEVARVLGLKKAFDLNYPNHRMGDVPLNELICRLIFLIRLLRVDTVVSFNPWARYEENPDHHQTARGVEAACWMAGRKHDYPEQLEAGLEVKTVQERYYFARNASGSDVNRVVDVSDYVEQMIDCNRANRAKGPAGTHGSQLRADLEQRGLRLPLLGSDDQTADRKFIEHFTLAGSRELGKKYGVKYAEAFHHIGGQTKADPVAEYVRENAEPSGK